MSLRDDDGGGNDYDDEDKNICGKKQERDKECQQQRNGDRGMVPCWESVVKADLKIKNSQLRNIRLHITVR